MKKGDTTLGEILHYKEQGFAERRLPLSQNGRDRSFGSVVAARVEVMVVCDDEILLDKGNCHPPLPAVWILGGDMIAGENPEDVAVRLVLERAGVDISKVRLTYLTSVSSAWRGCTSPEFGAHFLSVVYIATLFLDECADLRSGRSSDLIFLTLSTILTRRPDLHPLLIVIAERYNIARNKALLIVGKGY